MKGAALPPPAEQELGSQNPAFLPPLPCRLLPAASAGQGTHVLGAPHLVSAELMERHPQNDTIQYCKGVTFQCN